MSKIVEIGLLNFAGNDEIDGKLRSGTANLPLHHIRPKLFKPLDFPERKENTRTLSIKMPG